MYNAKTFRICLERGRDLAGRGCVSRDLGVAANKEWIGLGLASRVIYYIKELGTFQIPEPVGQVEGVSFYSSPLR